MKDFLIKTFGAEAVTDNVMTEFNAEMGKKFVAKANYNAKLKELEKANDTVAAQKEQLELLEHNAAGSEDLQKQIDTLKQQNEAAQEKYEKELADVRFLGAIDKALMKAKAVDPELVRVKLKTDDLKMNDDGTVSGLDERITEIKKDYAFLFESAAGKYSPAGGKDPSAAPATLGDALKRVYDNNNG